MMRFKPKSFTAILIFVVVLLYSGLVSAKEAGIIMKIKGNIFYGDQQKKRVKPFMKFKVGDLFLLEKDAQMQLVFYDNSRMEKWKGVVEVAIDESRGVDTAAGQKSVNLVSVSSSQVTGQGLRKIPDFYKKINTEIAGAAVSRGKLKCKLYKKEAGDFNAIERHGIDKIRGKYDALRSTSEPDDITPEMYAMGELLEYHLCQEIYSILIASALKKQPDNSALTEMKEGLEVILKNNCANKQHGKAFCVKE